MKYKRVRKLDVMGRTFKVYHRKMKDLDGNCCPIAETITIDPNAENKPRAVYHELNHATIFTCGLYEALGGNLALIEIICEQFARVQDDNFEYVPKVKK